MVKRAAAVAFFTLVAWQGEARACTLPPCWHPERAFANDLPANASAIGFHPAFAFVWYDSGVPIQLRRDGGVLRATVTFDTLHDVSITPDTALEEGDYVVRGPGCDPYVGA